jgi:hypothetical protein
MCQPSTIPFNAKKPASRPWSPTKRDRLIFHWVKFEGHTQSWVAHQFDIDQSTVSRIVDRYQRWIARGGPAQDSMSHEERIRANQWLTIERNEWILTSALRIAGKMEEAAEGSSTVIARNMAHPSQETEMRSESHTIDRSGIACRYLRLAFQINMVQKKLIAEQPLPALEPLTIEDAGDDPHQLEASARDSAGCHGHPARADRNDDASPAADPSNEPSEEAETHSKPPTASGVDCDNDSPIAQQLLCTAPATEPPAPPQAASPPSDVHIMHNAQPGKSRANRGGSRSFANKPRSKKNQSACIPSSTLTTQPSGFSATRSRPFTANEARLTILKPKI